MATQNQSKLKCYNNTASKSFMNKFSSAFMNFHQAHHSEVYVSVAITNSKLLNDQKYYKIKWKHSTQNILYSSWENKFIASFIVRPRNISPSAQHIDVDQEACTVNKFSFLAVFWGEYYAIDAFTTQDNYKIYQKSIKANVYDLIRQTPKDGTLSVKRVRFRPVQSSPSDLMLEIHKIILAEEYLPFQASNESVECLDQIKEQPSAMKDETHKQSHMVQQKNQKKHTQSDFVIKAPNASKNYCDKQSGSHIQPQVKIQQVQKSSNLPISLPQQAELISLQPKTNIKLEEQADPKTGCEKKIKMSYGLLDRLDLPKDIKEKLYFEPNLKILSHKIDKQNNWKFQVRNGSMQVFWLCESVLSELGYCSLVKQYRGLIELYNEAQSSSGQE